MKRRTVIISKINDDRTAFVVNLGIEELALFKKLKDNGIELKDDGNISDEEILMLLRHCCIDGFIEGVYSIENHFNRDQKQINIIKTNIENKLKAKGLTIITHTEWTPSFDYDPGPINKRNYLTVVIENINKNETKLEELEEEISETEKEYKDRIIQLENEYELKKQNLNKELDNSRIELEEIIKNNTAKIKHQNWYIEQTKNAENELNIIQNKVEENKLLLDKIIERYKKGKEICDKQEQNAKDNWPIELKELEIKIEEYRHELSKLDLDITVIKEQKEKEEQNLLIIKNQVAHYDTLLDNIIQKYQL